MTTPGMPNPALGDLYQEVILDHNRNPRNFCEIKNPTVDTEAYNPLCGDKFHLALTLSDEGGVEAIGFQGQGCAISKAAASMMTAKVKGKTSEQVKMIMQNFMALVTGNPTPKPDEETLGSLILFEGVKKFPIRVKCATLIWHALGDAMNQYESKRNQ